jgi:oligoribonuclease
VIILKETFGQCNYKQYTYPLFYTRRNILHIDEKVKNKGNNKIQMKWLLWTDIETTGLNVEKDVILQIACVLTDFKLQYEYIFPEFTFQCDKSKLEEMSDWCKTTHNNNGLLFLIHKSTLKIQEAQDYIVNVLNSHLTVKDTLHIAGNSVHFDKTFIDKYMPALARRLSHKIIDISSFGLVYSELLPEIYQKK